MEHRCDKILIFSRHPQAICGQDSRETTGIRYREIITDHAQFVSYNADIPPEIRGDVLRAVGLDGGEYLPRRIVGYHHFLSSGQYTHDSC